MSKFVYHGDYVTVKPIKYFWDYIHRYRDCANIELYIDGQTDGVFFYTKDCREFSLSYDDISNIEYGKTVTKRLRTRIL